MYTLQPPSRNSRHRSLAVAEITFNLVGSAGQSTPITLVDALASDASAQPVTVAAVNGSIGLIGPTAPSTPGPAPTAPGPTPTQTVGQLLTPTHPRADANSDSDAQRGDTRALNDVDADCAACPGRLTNSDVDVPSHIANRADACASTHRHASALSCADANRHADFGPAGRSGRDSTYASARAGRRCLQPSNCWYRL